MSAEATRQQPAGDDTAGRATVEERVERIATYWAHALIEAWRTVFPPRKDR